MIKKIGVNDKCFCGSDKKYKKCCFTKTEFYKESEMMTNSLTILQEQFPDIQFINVSDTLNAGTYNNLQLKQCQNNVCQVAERCNKNKQVFIERENEKSKNNNLILLYKGGYRLLNGGDSIYMYIMSLNTFLK